MSPLDPDTYRLILSILSTPDQLACAQVCTALRELFESILDSTGHAINVAGGSSLSDGARLLWLAKVRMRGGCTRMDVSGCEHVTKAQVAAAVTASPLLRELTCLRVGPGSWSEKQALKLLAAAPPSLSSFRLDMRLELKNDLQEGSPALSALSAAVRMERLTLIADNISIRPADANPSAAAAAAAMETLNIGDGGAAAAQEDDDDDDAVLAAPELTPELARLRVALEAQSAHLRALDASSGALSMASAGPHLLAPLLAAPDCALQELFACNLMKGVMRSLAPAIRCAAAAPL